MSIHTLAVAQPLLANAHHIDEKTIEGRVTLREFLAGTLSYYPGWIRLLYVVRAGFVRLLGMKQENMSSAPRLRPEDIAFTPGAQATFFTVEAAQEDAYWIAFARDSHLTAYLMVNVEALGDGLNRFHVTTVVHYHNWAGPIYFNVIRPFHHVVVQSMMRAGVRAAT
jgi:hypothetical protein